MKRKYESPAVQENYADVTFEMLNGSNIGQGGDGQDGDAKEFVVTDEDDWSDYD